MSAEMIMFEILKRAKTEEFRARLDAPAITTDIIVGFPGETDAEATTQRVRIAATRAGITEAKG